MNAKTLMDIMAEMQRADAAFGADNPDGTKSELTPLAESFKALVRAKDETGTVTWADILAEEVAEVLCEQDLRALRCELIQVAAVAVRWVRSIDARIGSDRFPYLRKLSPRELSAAAKRAATEAEAGRADADLMIAINREVELRTRGVRT